MKWTTVAAFILVILFLLGQATVSAAQIRDLAVTPRIADTETMFTFTLTYAGDAPPDEILVMIGDEARSMEELDKTDTNYSDGKQFYLSTRLEKGSYVCFFKTTVGDTVMRSGPYTLVVESGFGFEHMDIVLAVGVMGGIFIIPTIFMTIYLRRMSRDMKDILKEKQEPPLSDEEGPENNEGNEEPNS